MSKMQNYPTRTICMKAYNFGINIFESRIYMKCHVFFCLFLFLFVAIGVRECFRSKNNFFFHFTLFLSYTNNSIDAIWFHCVDTYNDRQWNENGKKRKVFANNITLKRSVSSLLRVTSDIYVKCVLALCFFLWRWLQ